MIIDRVLEDLISEIVLAGKDALRLFEAGVTRTFRKKPDRSPVTQADEAIEARLSRFVQRNCPHIGFLGEESAASLTNLQTPGATRFIVDPIDGTRAFLRGYATWSILVGLELQGEPVWGVAHLPVTGEVYWAKKGEGAYRRDRGSAHDARLQVSQISQISDACIAHGALLQFVLSGLSDPLLALTGSAYSLRGMQDFSGHQAVLEGRAEAMLDPDLKPWDMCAVSVLVREAGGCFTSLHGEDSIYAGTALSTNGHVHHALVDVFNKR